MKFFPLVICLMRISLSFARTNSMKLVKDKLEFLYPPVLDEERRIQLNNASNNCNFTVLDQSCSREIQKEKNSNIICLSWSCNLDLLSAQQKVDVPWMEGAVVRMKCHIEFCNACDCKNITPPVTCDDVRNKVKGEKDKTFHQNVEIWTDPETYPGCESASHPPPSTSTASTTTTPSALLLVALKPLHTTSSKILLLPIAYIIFHFALSLYLRPEDWHKKKSTTTPNPGCCFKK